MGTGGSGLPLTLLVGDWVDEREFVGENEAELEGDRAGGAKLGDPTTHGTCHHATTASAHRRSGQEFMPLALGSVPRPRRPTRAHAA
jgi:hypothetical protein